MKKIILLSVIGLIFTACEKENQQSNEEYATGVLPDKPDAYQYIPPAAFPPSTGNLPSSYMLEMPPAGDQGQQGSCTAWAVAYAMKSYQRKEANNLSYGTNNSPNYSTICSPAYVYNQIKAGTCSYGSYITDALDLLIAEGVCSWTQMPYNENDCEAQPTAVHRGYAADNRIERYAIVPIDRDDVKKALYNNFPVIIAIKLNCEFYDADDSGSFIWTNDADNGCNVLHAVTVYGYDDALSAFRILNSWGQQWGEEGSVWVNYDLFESRTDQAYIAYDFSYNTVGGVCTVNTNLFEFGTVQINSPVTKSLIIGNSGNASYNLNGIHITGSLAYNHNFTSSSITINPGDTHEVDITFKPTAPGQFNGTLNLVTDAASGANAVVLRGLGTTNPIDTNTFGCSQFTDPRDGNHYNVIQFHGQCWMAENLKYEIPSSNSWYYFQKCYEDDPQNCETYGRLYSWEAIMNGESASTSNPSNVQGICPLGWHIPSKLEWEELLSFFPNEQTAVEALTSGGTAGTNFPLAGMHDSQNSGPYEFTSLNSKGFYWTSDVEGFIIFNTSPWVTIDGPYDGNSTTENREFYSCRCVAD